MKQIEVASIEEQIKCVAREIALRRTCYPRWVKDGKMRAADSDRELATMEAVMDTLKASQRADNLISDIETKSALGEIE